MLQYSIMSLNYFSNLTYQYTLKSELKDSLQIKKDKILTLQTIKTYQTIHPDLSDVYMKAIKAPLQKISKSDRIVKFEGNCIYFHTYRLLLWIHQHLEALDYYESDTYKKYSFAKYKSATSKFARDYKKNIEAVFNPSISVKKEYRLNIFVLRKYIRNRKLTDMFFNSHTLFPRNNINYDAFEANDENINLIHHLQNYYASSYIKSENVIYESLAIILHGYMTLKMGINNQYANKCTSEILYNLFNYESKKTSYDRRTNIYISGRITNMPIFKNHKSVNIHTRKTKNQFIKFLDEIKKDFLEFENFTFSGETYFQSNPLKAYFEQYPMEFLSKVE